MHRNKLSWLSTIYPLMEMSSMRFFKILMGFQYKYRKRGEDSSTSYEQRERRKSLLPLIRRSSREATWTTSAAPNTEGSPKMETLGRFFWWLTAGRSTWVPWQARKWQLNFMTKLRFSIRVRRPRPTSPTTNNRLYRYCASNLYLLRLTLVTWTRQMMTPRLKLESSE
jgi:hypothetical protein